MSEPKGVKRLVERFERNRDAYRSSEYNETQARREFIDPFFIALGWDVTNEKGYAEAYKEVIHEDAIKVGGATKAPDYCFRIGGTRRFFVEAKRPSVGIKDDPIPAYQLRRYAWSAKLPLSILTDFEEFAVYDCRVKPSKTDKASAARILYITYTEYAERWDEIALIFSQGAILTGSFDRYVESTKRKRGTAEVDDAFLKEIEAWRDVLARNIALRNADLSTRELNFAVQRTIDRIIFLRICEDRGIEDYGQLMALESGPRAYKRLCQIFHRADERYNSGLFHFRKEKDRLEPPDGLTLSLIVDDKVLKEVLKDLYYPDSPYEFSVLPADILGHIYEQFLGKVIRLTPGHHAKVEDKPQVKKAGGVYYTPTYIVDYIVKHTVGKLLEGKTPQKASKLRVLDPACGSGSFLLGAYQTLLDWHLKWYSEHDPEKHAKGRKPKIFHGPGGDWRLTTSEKKRILLNNIYGVDIDPQAVEVTKLSLLLKVLEGENAETIGQSLRLFHQRALPDLADNIKCGNSLIGPDFYEGKQLSLLDEEERYRINAFDWNAEFPEIMQAGGFDAVIGNPPYLKIEHIPNEDRNYYFQTYDSCMKRFDTFGLFIERSTLLLSSRGLFGMIIPSTVLNNLTFTNLRRLLLNKTAILTIVNLGGKIFQGVNNDTLILVYRNQSTEGTKTALWDVSKYGAGLRKAELIATRALTRAPPPDYPFELRMADADLIIEEKMRAGGLSLGDLCGCFQGFVTGSNEAYVVTSEEIERQNLERTLCQPAVFGNEISRYGEPKQTSWVIYLSKGTDIHQFPNVFRRLLPYKKHLERKREVQLGRQPWYTLHWARKKENFERTPKILVQAIRNLALKRRVIATLDTIGLFADHTLFVIYPKSSDLDLYLILGILNSQLINYLFSRKYVDINIKGKYLGNVPLSKRLLNDPDANEIADLARELLRLHSGPMQQRTDHEKSLIQRQIDATDKQIDQLVYELYGLTDEEIRIVEEATK